MTKLKLIAVLVLASCAFAQSDRGTITGTVADSSGALIPNAKISLTNSATQSRYDTVTSGTGNYTIPTLPVGLYDLSVEQPGFSAYKQTGIRVQVAVTTRVDVILQVGLANQTVEVAAETPMLRTQSADQSTNLV